jgi:hypothetical protein
MAHSAAICGTNLARYFFICKRWGAHDMDYIVLQNSALDPHLLCVLLQAA